MIGASAIFPYIVSSGLSFAPASDGGVLVPGMLPFWTALAAFLILGEKLDKYVELDCLLYLLERAIGWLCKQILFNSDEGVWRAIFFLLGQDYLLSIQLFFGKVDLLLFTVF